MTEKEIEETRTKLLEKLLKDDNRNEQFDYIYFFGILDGFQIWGLDNSIYELFIGYATYIKVNPHNLSYTWIKEDEEMSLWKRLVAENPELHTYEARKKRTEAKRKRLMEYRKTISKEQGIEFIP